jgi:hypothetical protein
MKRTMGVMPEPQLVVGVLLPFMSALAYLHARGFIHRDIKPENTLFTADKVLKLAGVWLGGGAAAGGVGAGWLGPGRVSSCGCPAHTAARDGCCTAPRSVAHCRTMLACLHGPLLTRLTAAAAACWCCCCCRLWAGHQRAHGAASDAPGHAGLHEP